MKFSDYEKFTVSAKALGAQRIKTLGQLDDNVVVEAWYFNAPPRRKGQGFILMHNLDDHTIGVYEFVGKDGGSVDDDIKWLMAMYGRIAEGLNMPQAGTPMQVTVADVLKYHEEKDHPAQIATAEGDI